MNNAYGLGVIHGYTGVPYENPFYAEAESNAYDEGYAYGEEMFEEEEV